MNITELEEQLRLSEERNKGYRHLIAVLLTKLGGRVTIKPAEVIDVGSTTSVSVHRNVVDDTLEYEVTT